jgi:Family of unknown function (DUF6335)
MDERDESRVMASRHTKPAHARHRGGHARRRRRPQLDESRRRQDSATAVAAEVWRTGVLPSPSRRRQAIPHEDELMLVGDPDDDGLANEYVGEDLPGGSTPTPDQCNVDEIGRAYGLQDEDNGSLRTSSEVLARRDRRRIELRPPRRPQS